MVGCEKGCYFFSALSPEEQTANRRARTIIGSGGELPGSLNTMCGSCKKYFNNYADLEEKYTKLIKIENADSRIRQTTI